MIRGPLPSLGGPWEQSAAPGASALHPAGDRGAFPAVRLRRMRWWDVDAVLSLERELFGSTAWSPEIFWSELSQIGSRWYLVAEDAPDEIVGYAGLLSSGAEADVQTIAVSPRVQGQGVGATLLSALLHEAARRSCTVAMLEVSADNEPAIALYRRFGFERIAVRRAYYQPGDVDAWVMRLRPVPTVVH